MEIMVSGGKTVAQAPEFPSCDPPEKQECNHGICLEVLWIIVYKQMHLSSEVVITN